MRKSKIPDGTLIGGIAYNHTVREKPGFTVHRWFILDIKGERHVLGDVHDMGYSRISSPIRAIDPIARTATTRTGRVYTLAGGRYQFPSTDAGWVLDTWLRANGFTQADVTDVTGEVVPEGASASSEEGEGST